jgi:reactive intermediate/imine deaminase
MTDNNAYRISTDPDRTHDQHHLGAGYRVGNLIFLSGQVAVNENSEIIGEGDMAAQTRQAFANLGMILERAGSNLNKIIKSTTFITDISQLAAYREAKEEVFVAPYPAGTIVEVSKLGRPGLMIEIEAVALAEGELVG